MVWRRMWRREVRLVPRRVDDDERLIQAGEGEEPVDLGGSAEKCQAPVLSVSVLGCIANYVEAGGVHEAQLAQVQNDQRDASRDLL